MPGRCEKELESVSLPLARDLQVQLSTTVIRLPHACQSTLRMKLRATHQNNPLHTTFRCKFRILDTLNTYQRISAIPTTPHASNKPFTNIGNFVFFCSSFSLQTTAMMRKTYPDEIDIIPNEVVILIP